MVGPGSLLLLDSWEGCTLATFLQSLLPMSLCPMTWDGKHISGSPRCSESSWVQVTREKRQRWVKGEACTPSCTCSPQSSPPLACLFGPLSDYWALFLVSAFPEICGSAVFTQELFLSLILSSEARQVFKTSPRARQIKNSAVVTPPPIRVNGMISQEV